MTERYFHHMRVHQSVRAALQGTSAEPSSWKDNIPWYGKIAAKLVLSRLPIGRTSWQVVGGMDEEGYAGEVISNHMEVSGIRSLEGMNVLELGPGNGLLSAKYLLQRGAKQVWLVDSARLTRHDDLPSGAEYLTDGLESLRTIATASINFLFSEAVLEHVRLREFGDTVAEIRRIVTPGTICSHSIDFRDHLQNALNHLRFRERMWESPLMSESGFYTNRMPLSNMISVFTSAGFTVRDRLILRWPSGLPTPQRAMAEPFRSLPAEELMAMRAHLILQAV